MVTKPAVQWRWLTIVFALTVSGGLTPSTLLAQQKDTTWNRPLPIAAEWALKQGIDLPNPFGIGVFLVTMSRDIEVYDVRVTLPGNEPVSIRTSRALMSAIRPSSGR